MIEIHRIDKSRKEDINLKNDPFPLCGRMIPTFNGQKWDYSIDQWPAEKCSKMRFPDENYCYEDMKDEYTFVGAYENGSCIGLAILRKGFFKYMYLYDLKVSERARRKGAGKLLIQECLTIAKELGLRGIYLVAQDNNLSACLFYIKSGFRIGGLDTEVYNGTNQEGKADILFYLDA